MDGSRMTGTGPVDADATDEQPGVVEGSTVEVAATDDDDVEGHNMGAVNQVLASELARAREQDIRRALSRRSLLDEVKGAARRKR